MYKDIDAGMFSLDESTIRRLIRLLIEASVTRGRRRLRSTRHALLLTLLLTSISLTNHTVTFINQPYCYLHQLIMYIEIR
jgi:hypothetical protein